MFTISVISIFLLQGCQKVIEVDLNNAEPRIVIEGLITDSPGPYAVIISMSGSYFNQPELPPVSDAFVTVSDDEGTHRYPYISLCLVYILLQKSGDIRDEHILSK